MRTPLSRFERDLYREGYRLIAGVDEAGRGPLAGPVVAAACLIPQNAQLDGIKDSKVLSPRVRKKLFWKIVGEAMVGVGVASEREIEQLNILNASLLAMRRAVLALSVTPDLILVDGNRTLDLPLPQIAVVRGDAKLISVGAASIVAKVTRDEMMELYDGEYPEYGFKQHKGYPTPAHIAILEERGPSPIHRKTFRPVARFISSDEHNV